MFNLVPWKRRNRDDLPVAQDRSYREGPLAEFRDEFDALWDRFWGSWNRSLSPWDEDLRFGLDSGWMDKEDEYVLRADLPGFEPEEIDLKLSGNALTISADHKDEKKTKNGASYRYGSCRRQFAVPAGIVKDQIDARYHNGVLEVHLPKCEDSKAKRIPVSTA